MSLDALAKYKRLARLAFHWGSGSYPFTGFFRAIEKYTEIVPEDGDRGFWLGEVLGHIRHDAEHELTRTELTSYDREVTRLMSEYDAKRKVPFHGVRNPSGDITYGDFYATGVQDCGNAFDLAYFQDANGKLNEDLTAEQIVANGMADWDDTRQSWIDQNEDSIEGLDPVRAFQEWKRGWAACAVKQVRAELEEMGAVPDPTRQRFAAMEFGKGQGRETTPPEDDTAKRFGMMELNPRRNPPRRMREQHVTSGSKRRPLKTSLVATELVKSTGADPWPINSPDDVVMALADYIGKRSTEVFVVVFVNIRNQAVGYIEFTEGSLASVAVAPSEIYRAALAAAAPAFITAHNHPSGNADPSADDRALWKQLRAGAQTIGGIHLLDNFVLGEDEYYSESMGATKRYPGSVDRIREVEST